MRESQVGAVIATAVIGLAGAGSATAAFAAARHRPLHRHGIVHRRGIVRHSTAAPVPSAAPVPTAPPLSTAASSAPATGPRRAVPCADGDLIPSLANLDRVRAAILCLVNARRAEHGTAPLGLTVALQLAADRHANEMAAQDDYGHGAADVCGLVAATGLTAVGENIAAGGGGDATATTTVTAWMGSPEHRANILDPSFAETGIGVAASVPASLGLGPVGATFAQCFGSRG